MLNLHRCWQTGFPSESELMEEVKEFSTSQLTKAFSEGDPSLLKPNNLGHEIKYALAYPRRYNLLRLESRSIIRQLWPTSTGYKQMCLQLAKHDLAMLQKIHKQETEALEKWWEEEGASKLEFSRPAVVKSHFGVSVAVFEPEFAAFRMAFVKAGCLVTLVDDLFDAPKFGVDGLSRFTDSFLRWDESGLDDLPEHKVVFTTLKNNVVDMAAESSRAQGRNLFPLFKAMWDDGLAAVTTEAKWRSTRHVPTWDEYIRIGRATIAADPCVWCALFLMGHPITDDILRCIGPNTRFMQQAALVARLSNDLATFRREASCGEMASAVNCYMRDHPGESEEEAVAAIDRAVDSACRELEWELFKSRAVVPEFCARAALNFARTMAFLYMRADAFSSACDEEYEGLSQDYMSGSIA
ncbi:bifunctional levopimaradiene synthase, chloroplastic-like [Ananas comosus]|uniref:Bifunctional levopimaradiene synthase, chloroplastic-like n=2 Tax=Ananas comosus TaxID=4615 RepID=A0A6P5EXC4_ANACO|nr:bifunctional levopimaradiene synthase, chloroplastic-like [Ananas comosus]XP_020085819.1 bifunctional levopimaradiene synthase, chloroplastic-like [Ananas comosus]XP_020085825.1 bifunctional levopimaradiene synthase, chloroplastic-like [Ananas comosus]